MNSKALVITLSFASLFADIPFYGNPAEECPEPFRIYTMADYLYWQASESDLEYVMVLESTTQAKAMDIDYPYKDGFRFGGGAVFPGNDWQLEINWTRFYHNLHTEKGGESFDLIALWMHPEDRFISWKRGSFSWDLKFDTLDLDLLRVGFVNENFSLTPYIGLKRSWIKQFFHVRYEAALDTDDGSLPNAWYNVRYSNDFRCIGPSLGFDARLWMPYDFNLAFGAATAISYGEFHLHRIDMSSQYTNLDLIEDINRFKPMAQALIAFEWSRCFSKSWRILASVGYEAQVWWGQNQQRIFISDALPPSNFKANANLIFQGLTCHARFDF